MHTQGLDKAGLYGAAWRALDHGNHLMSVVSPYDPETDRKALKIIKNVFKRE